MHIKRPILKPYDKDKFELVQDYEIEISICKTQNKNAKALHDDDLDCDIFLDLDKADEQVQGSVYNIRNRSTKRNLTPYKLKSITIPKGYKTNGADIPRLFWCIFPPNSPEYLSAVIVHDYLCDEAEKIYKLGFKPKARERFKFADVVLKEMMSAIGCNRLKTNIFYYACRVYHKLRYKEY
ncbi:hypothetical protein LMG7974_01663 [Campylobacter majalis]|uniref:DUF1353 domain-containing protein n=1 Tax=Campylobacter majalis TaxID=2790656 RepID=A0ABM8Q9U5_9BACT|nr:DUF1353 domain-containing protein [Campylobacter majalis]CAD7289586.1 hypothetical protein LMG7974_01663 [Campylobacter majalis]